MVALAVAIDAAAQFGGSRGGFGGVGGGGARPTGGSNLGYNRAGTASSGGFAYGDAPRMPAGTVVDPGVVGAAPGLPCNAAPVSVNGTPYYKCGATWYSAGLTSTGITYMKVPPPPGH
jgi:hypothetical protein